MIPDFERQQYKIRENVLFLCNNYPEIVNVNHNQLVLRYWQKIDCQINDDPLSGIMFFSEAETWRLTSSESITRAFRQLVADGLIELPEDQSQVRESLEAEYREVYG